MRLQRRAPFAMALLALAGCSTPPPYSAPKLELPASWSTEAPWRAGSPGDALPKGPWWQRFGDPVLDGLAQQALARNATLEQATARLVQARATLSATSAAVLPQVGVGERATRSKISANRPLTNYSSKNFSTVQNDLAATLQVNYELDLAGRVQSTIDGAAASAEQLAADLENTRLLLTADLAGNYFNLRAIDSELDVVQRSLAVQQRALDYVRTRHQLGAATGLDVAQQEASLEATRVQVDLLRRQRGLFEHAIATLSGTPAPSFKLAPDLRAPTLPRVPLGMPSDLLERRPDIASAERAVAAANAQIGVARAAFYPSITLGSTLGLDSRALGSLFEAPSLLWSLGLAATQVLFDGGRTQALVDAAGAGHAAATANYRRVVLGAMQEVEDGLGGLTALEAAAAQSATALAAARRVHEMASARYEAGATSTLEVITAQQALLASERQATQLLGQRLVTTVFLVKALGGDWERRTLVGNAAP
jgi:NodT family efflux transporter outer membrane factor (OMF) lipoprotein